MSEISPIFTSTHTDRVHAAFRVDSRTPSGAAIDRLHSDLLSVSDETALASAQEVINAFPTDKMITALNHAENNLLTFMEHKRTLNVVQDGLDLLAPGQDPALLTLSHATDMLTSVLNRRRFDRDEAVASMEMLDSLVLPEKSSELFIPGSTKHEVDYAFGRLQFASDRHKIASAAVMLSVTQPYNGAYASMARTSVDLYNSPPSSQIHSALSR